jgi:aryl-alcohol dehydrogenase-like predicted oxidoreductase
MDRRKFLKASTIGVFGYGLMASTRMSRLTGHSRALKGFPVGSSEAKIQDFRILGRTGFKVSDLAVGYVNDEGVMSAMLDAGMNYIDTGESYPGAHQLIGKVTRDRDRKSIFITSKMLMEGETSKQALIKRVEKCLEDLGTDYIDCMMLHCPETVEELKHEGFHAAMKELKANGRIHFTGASNHGSFWYRDSKQSMDTVLLAAAEDGRFDVVSMAYNFLKMDQAEKVIDVCNQKKIGISTMKTTPIAKYHIVKNRVELMEKEGKKIPDFYQEGLERYKQKADLAEKFIKKHDLKNPEEIRAAAIKFVLANPHVNTVCCSLQTYDEIDRILPLSGEKLIHT